MPYQVHILDTIWQFNTVDKHHQWWGYKSSVIGANWIGQIWDSF